MRFSTLRAFAIILALTGETSILRGQMEKQATTEARSQRIADLIRQLSHDEFAKRQAASKELEAIGEPALAALRKAAESSDSVEARQRAEQIIRAIAAQKTRVVLTSSLSHGLPLAESKHPVHSISIEAQVNAKGEGKGKITLHLTAPNYDEYGDFVIGNEVDGVNRSQRNQRPPVVLDCAIEFVKAGFVGRVNEPSVNRSLFRIKGQKTTSSLFVATQGPGLTSGRLLVLGKDQRVDYVLDLTEVKPITGKGSDGPPPPCHPGCFPAGTLVIVPDGTKRIELIRSGEAVTTIGMDGMAARSIVQEVFTSKNRLVEVRTDNGIVVTTLAQPFCLTDGSFRRAPGPSRVWWSRPR